MENPPFRLLGGRGALAEPHFFRSFLSAAEYPVCGFPRRRMLERFSLYSVSWGLLFPQPSPGWGSPVASWWRHPAPASGRQGWQSYGHAAQLRASPPQFIPSRYTVAAFYLDRFSVLWYLGCFSIPPNPRGRFLRRLVFGAGFEHICSLAVAFQEGPVRGLRSQGCMCKAVETVGRVQCFGW